MTNTPGDDEPYDEAPAAVTSVQDPPDSLPPEPGSVPDAELGVAGREDPLPDGDAEDETGLEI